VTVVVGVLVGDKEVPGELVTEGVIEGVVEGLGETDGVIEALLVAVGVTDGEGDLEGVGVGEAQGSGGRKHSEIHIQDVPKREDGGDSIGFWRQYISPSQTWILEVTPLQKVTDNGSQSYGLEKTGSL